MGKDFFLNKKNIERRTWVEQLLVLLPEYDHFCGPVSMRYRSSETIYQY